MSLWSRIAGLAQRKAGSGTFSMFEEFGATGAGVPVTSFSAMQHVMVMACVSILAEDLAKLPLQIYRRRSDGGKEVAKEHPLYRLLRAPNPWQTRVEFIEMMHAALKLRGNAYAAIIRDLRGRTEMLVPIHPDRVTLYEAPGGDYFYLVQRSGLHDMAVLSSLPLMVHHDDMLHLRWLSAWNTLIGQSRISLMREAIGLTIAQEQLAARLAGSGARPSGVLKTDKVLSPEVITRLKETWQSAQGGWRNAGKTAVLEEGLQWQQLGMTLVDAQFLELARLSREDIARGFRVPLHKVGIPAEGGGASIEQQDQEYVNNVLAGDGERWIAKLAQTFDVDAPTAVEAEDGETFLEFDYEAMFKAALQTRYTAYRIAIVGGFKTINEVRRREGDPKVEHGDTLLQPTNMAPLGWTPPDKSAAGPGSETTGAPAAGGNGDALRDPSADADKAMELPAA